VSKTRTGVYPDEKTIRLDNTALNAFRRCPAEFGYRHGLNLVPTSDAESEHPPLALHYGIAWHSAMDVLYETKNIDEAKEKFLEASDGLADDPKNRKTRGRGVTDLEHYWSLYKAEIEALELIANELIVSTRIALPDDWTLEYVGAVDKVVRMPSGKIKILDHKTLGYLTMYTPMQYELSNQLTGYGVIIRDFYGMEDDEVYVQADIVGPTRSKPPSEYLRPEILVDEVVAREWKEDITATANMIIGLHTNGGVYPRYGHDACGRFGSLCTYFRLCSASPGMRERVEANLYTVLPWDPGERHEEGAAK